MSRFDPRHTPRAFWTLALAAALAVALSAYDWPQFGFNSRHSSNNTQESVINTFNVVSLQRILHVNLPSIADGAPAYLSNVSTISGTVNVLFLTTKDGHILALNGLTGATIWSHQYGPNGCKINQSVQDCFTTSSPAVDPNRQYVYSYGLDGYAHKYQVFDGTEIKTGGWPELTTLKPFSEKGSSALSIATARSAKTFLYVTNGGYPGDSGDYQGHVTAINLGDGTQRVFNSQCSNQAVHFTTSSPNCNDKQSAIWARPGVIYDPDTNKIYMATGNGIFNPGSYDWADTVFALNPNGTGSGGNPLDSYTPSIFRTLQGADLDLGSTAPAILPNNSLYPHLAVQSGKDRLLRLINLDNLSGQGGPGHIGGEIFIMPVPQGTEVLSQPTVWVNPSDGSTWVFVANTEGLAALKLVVNGGQPSLVTQWLLSSGGTTPIVANGVLFYAGTGNLVALDPVSHRQLWQSTQIGGIHWESPIVADGVLYVTDENHTLSAYRPSAPNFAPQAYFPFVAR